MDAVKNKKNHREQNGEYGPGFSASSETSGQELCSVLLEVYDSAPSRQSLLTTNQEQALVCAVLSALLALSHAAKRIALQGEEIDDQSYLIIYFNRAWLLFEVSKRGLAVNFTIISLIVKNWKNFKGFEHPGPVNYSWVCFLK